MKKWICNILILIITLIVIVCITLAITGSLEMFPTKEQIGKARLVYSMLTVIFLIIDIVLISVRIKIHKKFTKKLALYT